VLQQPAAGEIVGTFHIGVPRAVSAAIRASNPNALAIRQRPPVTAEVAAAAVKRAVDHVRGGGVVMLTLDGPGGTSTVDVECLGRRIVFRRGAFAVARLTKRPLTLVVSGWSEDGRIDLRISQPIEPASEDQMAALSARWLENYLRERPGDLPSNSFQYLWMAPRAELR
jgi:hypothetical protein